MSKGFEKGRVEPPIEINKIEHTAEATKIQPEKHEKPNTCSQMMKHQHKRYDLLQLHQSKLDVYLTLSNT